MRTVNGILDKPLKQRRKTMNWNDITDAQWNEANNWFEANGYKVHDSDEGGFTFCEPVNGKQFYSAAEGWKLYQKLANAK